MYRIPKMAKVNIFCYAHLLIRFRVNKEYTLTMFRILYCTVHTFLGKSCALSVTVLTKHISSGTGLQRCRVLVYSNTNLFSMPVPKTNH